MATHALTPDTFSQMPTPLVQLAIHAPKIADAVQLIHNKTNRPQRIGAASARSLIGQFCANAHGCDTHFKVGIEITDQAPLALVVVADYQGFDLLKQSHHQLRELVDDLCRAPDPSERCIDDINQSMAIVMRITTTTASIWMRPKAEMSALTWRTITTSEEASVMTDKVRESIEKVAQTAESALFWGEPLWNALFNRVVSAAHKAGFSTVLHGALPPGATGDKLIPCGWKFSHPMDPDREQIISISPRKATFGELLSLMGTFLAHAEKTEAQKAASAELLSLLKTANPIGTSERAQALLEDLQAELEAGMRLASR